jgi:hypothetical protein
MQKFEFSIKTRGGQLIERLNIAGRDQADAERKLKQMYHYCEIVHCEARQPKVAKAGQLVSVEELLSLIAK